MPTMKVAWIIALFLISATVRCDHHSGSRTDTDDVKNMDAKLDRDNGKKTDDGQNKDYAKQMDDVKDNDNGKDMYFESEKDDRKFAKAFFETPMDFTLYTHMFYLVWMRWEIKTMILLITPEFLLRVKCPGATIDPYLKPIKIPTRGVDVNVNPSVGVPLNSSFERLISDNLSSLITLSFNSMISELEGRSKFPDATVDPDFELVTTPILQTRENDVGRQTDEFPAPNYDDPYETAIFPVIWSTIRTTIRSTVPEFQKTAKEDDQTVDNERDFVEIIVSDEPFSFENKTLPVFRSVIRSAIRSAIRSKIPGFLRDMRCNDLKVDPTTSQKPEKKCDPGFDFLPEAETCYKVVYEEHNWTSAGQRCRDLNPKAHLAAITSGIENKDLKSYLRLELRNNRHIKVCGSPQNDTRNLWTSGQRVNKKIWRRPFAWKIFDDYYLNLTFTDWMPGEPNFLGRKERCLNLYIRLGYQSGWTDLSCNTKICPLCEYDPE